MAAQPARWLSPDRPVSYWDDNRATDSYEVTVRDVDADRQPIGPEYAVKLTDLSNGETYKAAAAVGLNPKDYNGPGALLRRISAIQHALMHGADWKPRNATGAPKGKKREYLPAPTPEESPNWTPDPGPEPFYGIGGDSPPIEHPKPIIAPPIVLKDAQTDPVVAMTDLLQLMVKDAAAGALDETAIRAIIREETVNLRPHVTRIEVEGRDPIEVEGRQHAQFPKLVKLLGMGENVFLVGPMGTGKTTMAEQAAQALGLPFYAMSCAGQLPSAFWGFVDATGNYQPTNTRRAYEFGGVMTYDELDAGTANAMTAVNMLTANAVCAFPDGMVKRHPDFRVIATANTYGTGATAEYVGRNILDAATLDRFTKLPVPIDEELERDLIGAWLDEVAGDEWHARVKKYRANIASHGLKVNVSPRSAVSGAKMIAGGFTIQEVIEMRVMAGFSEDIARKVEGR